MTSSVTLFPSWSVTLKTEIPEHKKSNFSPQKVKINNYQYIYLEKKCKKLLPSMNHPPSEEM